MSGAHTTSEIERDVVHTIEWLHGRTGISRRRLLKMAELQPSRYNRWRQQPDRMHELGTRKTGSTPRLLPEEQDAIIAYREEIKHSGRSVSYRIQTYEMLDRDIVAVSESTVYRTLKPGGYLSRRDDKEPSKKGTGFIQPRAVHEHWHTDISYLWEFGYRRYLVSVLDGFSRAILHHKVLTTMGTGDIELVLQRTHELYADAKPKLITDNGSQFISNQFKGFLADKGFTHVRTSTNYPQANGKIERQFRTIKEELRAKSILSCEDMEQQIQEIIDEYNFRRYHSALGYVAPMDVVLGRDPNIKLQRRRKLDEAAAKRFAVHSQFIN